MFPRQLLRRMLDDKVLCTMQRPFEWRTIEGLVIFSTMSMSDYASVSNKLLAPRMLVSVLLVSFLKSKLT